MLVGHNPYLVALSLVIAIAGGYTGFGLAARVRVTSGFGRRLLLAGAAGFLALGIWTMHFVGMLAAPLPADAVYLVLPTVVSFLICALVVGISLFFVSIGEPSRRRLAASAVLLGVGIVSMHYVGIHALAGGFHMEHAPAAIALASLVAVGTAYGGLHAFLARQGGARLALSAVAFGVAVSGMHYTAMAGMRLVPASEHAHMAGAGIAASAQVMAPIVALLCFLIAAGFLLFLVPDAGDRAADAAALAGEPLAAGAAPADAAEDMPAATPGTVQRQGGADIVERVPVEGVDGIQLVGVADIRSIRADAHYTQVHDGSRERMCAWSISQAEARLDPATFFRAHRSHIIALPHVVTVRKEGDGGLVELDGNAHHKVPVSRSRMAELRARLGVRRPGSHAALAG